MTLFRKLVLILLTIAAVATSAMVLSREDGLCAYRKLLTEVAGQRRDVARMAAHNEWLKRQVFALAYDHRAIERESRDLLMLVKSGEIVVLLPR